MDPGNTLCSVCGSKVAEMFCPCVTPETFLCVGCTGGHTIKAFGGVHPVRPINQLPYYKLIGYTERLCTRMELFPQVRDRVHQQVKLVDQAIEEFTDEMEKWYGNFYSIPIRQ